jgi:ubiquinone/menaquinone biosynthesis C-methylase UbiE
MERRSAGLRRRKSRKEMTVDDAWRRRWLTEGGDAMRRVYFKRAVGELPEMESSKAAAARVQKFIRPNDRIADVGCGAGHYLRSLRLRIDVPFTYTGVDATPSFLELARQAYAGDDGVSFQQGDIFGLPLEDAAFDIVMSNNVLLHLPSIEKPIRELCRASRRRVLIRTLVGDRTFRIQEVHAGDDSVETFDSSGEPKDFNFFNIYSRVYVESILKTVPGVRRYTIDLDTDADPQGIEANAAQFGNDATATRMLGPWQCNGYILLPWSFIDIEMEN